MLLGIYLNDHLAGATLARELASRSARSNRGTAYGDFLEHLRVEIEEDRGSLLAIMEVLGVGEDRLKLATAWALEKAGRLKLNGRLLGYSPYSRALELETLRLGVQGKLAMWLALRHIQPAEPRLERRAIDALIERAEQQAEHLEAHRLRAAADAFTPAATPQPDRVGDSAA
ncbi:MAG: hypothetical protein QOK19_276 [Solirubrobacteraceae bacterium]|jgi:hypothetical protein|nr:hypothetical protein [Solirubrobacteraceae bacterium]